MKTFSFILPVLMCGLLPKVEAQVITAVDCDLMELVCNVCSQTNSINLYHPGGYLTFPSTDNVMEWAFTDSQGNVLHEETLVDNNFVGFNFDLDLMDTMYVSVLLTNDSAVLNGGPVACLIEDYLVWEVTEIVPGFPQGAWTLGGSIGVDLNETSPGGCMYPLACNYDAGATFDDGSCSFPPVSCAWPDTWAAGCTYADADNYDASAAVDDGSCTWAPCNTCPEDINGDGAITISDVLLLLGAFGMTCS